MASSHRSSVAENNNQPADQPNKGKNFAKMRQKHLKQIKTPTEVASCGNVISFEAY